MDRTQSPSRRNLLWGAAAGGVVVASAAVGAGTAAALGGGDQFKRESLMIEVSCLGDKFRTSTADSPANDADFRAPFSVEGFIYPVGTTSEGYIPTDTDAIRVWMCRGWLINDGDRDQPHTYSDQLYVDQRRAGVPARHHDLPGTREQQRGVQPRTPLDHRRHRRVLRATGQVTEQWISTNSTVFPWGDNAFNFRFEFDLLLP